MIKLLKDIYQWITVKPTYGKTTDFDEAEALREKYGKRFEGLLVCNGYYYYRIWGKEYVDCDPHNT